MKGEPYPEWMKEIMITIMSVCDIHDPDEYPTACYIQHFEGRDQSQEWYNMCYDIFGGSHMSGRTISLSMGVARNFLIRHPWYKARASS